MKPNYLIKSLTPLSFVLFFLPFLQMCASDTKTGIKSTQSIAVEKTEGVEIEMSDTSSHSMFKDSDFVVNAYQLGLPNPSEITKTDFKKLSSYGAFCYTFCILFSLVMVFFAFKNQFKSIAYFAATNLALLLLSTLIFHQSGVLKSFEQIKYGYYLFVLNTILIWFFSRQAVKRRPELYAM